MNQIQHGVVPTSLKVYEWFDDDSSNRYCTAYKHSCVPVHPVAARPMTEEESLSKEQVDELIRSGRVAVKNDVLKDKDILIEELLNGPYFGDGRHTAES